MGTNGGVMMSTDYKRLELLRGAHKPVTRFACVKRDTASTRIFHVSFSWSCWYHCTIGPQDSNTNNQQQSYAGAIRANLGKINTKKQKRILVSKAPSHRLHPRKPATGITRVAVAIQNTKHLINHSAHTEKSVHI